MSPIRVRSSVLLPEPDRPRSATISPSSTVRLIRSRTGSGWPSGVVKVLTRSWAWRSGPPRETGEAPVAARSSGSAFGEGPGSELVKAEARLGQAVQGAPEAPVVGQDEDPHHEHARRHVGVELAGAPSGDVGAQSGGHERGRAPAHALRHDAGVPA